MNANMDWADAMKLFMGGGFGDIYDEEVLNLKVYGVNSIAAY